MSEEGWVADGKLTFRKEDDSPFICTYEATSLDKIEEVKYRLNSPYFVWDSIAFGTVAAAVLYFLFYQSRLPWLIGLKGSGNLGFVLGIFIIGFLPGISACRTGVSTDTYSPFSSSNNILPMSSGSRWLRMYFLRHRTHITGNCATNVYNGIGLALVPFAGNVRKINDPSRLGIYGKDKQMAHWVTRADWYKK